MVVPVWRECCCTLHCWAVTCACRRTHCAATCWTSAPPVLGAPGTSEHLGGRGEGWCLSAAGDPLPAQLAFAVGRLSRSPFSLPPRISALTLTHTHTVSCLPCPTPSLPLFKPTPVLCRQCLLLCAAARCGCHVQVRWWFWCAAQHWQAWPATGRCLQLPLPRFPQLKRSWPRWKQHCASFRRQATGESQQ